MGQTEECYQPEIVLNLRFNLLLYTRQQILEKKVRFTAILLSYCLNGAETTNQAFFVEAPRPRNSVTHGLHQLFKNSHSCQKDTLKINFMRETALAKEYGIKIDCRILCNMGHNRSKYQLGLKCSSINHCAALWSGTHINNRLPGPPVWLPTLWLTTVIHNSQSDFHKNLNSTKVQHFTLYLLLSWSWNRGAKVWVQDLAPRPPLFLFGFLDLIQTARGTHHDVWQGGNDSFLYLWYNFLLIHTIATIPLPSSHHDIHQSPLRVVTV